MSSNDNSFSVILSDLVAIAGGVAAVLVSGLAIASGLCFANSTLPLIFSLFAAFSAVFGVFVGSPQPILAHAPVGVSWTLLYLALVCGSVWLLYAFSFALGFWGKVWSVVIGMALAPILYAAAFLGAALLIHIAVYTILMCVPISFVLAFLAFLKGQI